MEARFIGVYVTLLYLFLCVFAVDADMKITEEQFKQFQGYDIVSSCAMTPAMNHVCNVVSPNHDGTCSKSLPIPGYPKCLMKAYIQLRNSKGQPVKHCTTMLACAWKKDSWIYLGKGQHPNTVIEYITGSEGDGIPTQEILIT